MKLLLDAFSLSLTQQKTYPVPDKPRVGGINENGAWTGYGAAQKGKNPRTKDCMRKFRMDPSRTINRCLMLKLNVGKVFVILAKLYSA